MAFGYVRTKHRRIALKVGGGFKRHESKAVWVLNRRGEMKPAYAVPGRTAQAIVPLEIGDTICKVLGDRPNLNSRRQFFCMKVQPVRGFLKGRVVGPESVSMVPKFVIPYRVLQGMEVQDNTDGRYFVKEEKSRLVYSVGPATVARR